MPRRVDARDVLDADATTSRAFSFAETPIQIEKQGAAFRMRRHGEVVLVTWVPEEGDDAGADLRERFLKTCVRDDDPTPDGNFALWLHRELSSKREPND